jgi:hypothetical protein
VPDPSMEIKSISQEGLLRIEFNQEMLVPSKINTTQFQSVITLMIKPDFDPTQIFYGKFVDYDSDN